MNEKKMLIACLIGTVLEWYDFSLFGALSPFLSTIFFPHETQSIALALTLAIFATGFIMRPLGAVFFGHIGDKYGRKKAVILSMMTMTTATVLMGLLPILPTHALATVIMLVALRILQGFSVSGELAGVGTFLSESLKHNKRFFFYMSLTGSSQVGGLLLGSVIGSIAFSLQQQYAFSWRIPFLLSLVLGAIGFYLRKRVIETPIFQKMQAQHILAHIPLAETLRKYKKIALFATAIITCASVSTYFLALAYPIYIKGMYGEHDFFMVQITMLSIATLISPFLSLFITQKNIMPFTASGFLLIAIAIMPLVWLAKQYQSMITMFFIGVVYALCYVPLRSTISTVLCLVFPHRVRYTGIGFADNLAVLLGGTFPLISTALSKKTGSLIASGAIIALLTLLAAVVLFSMRQRVTIIQENEVGL